MSALKLRISYGGFEMELEGEDGSVKELFNVAKEDMIVHLINNNPKNSTDCIENPNGLLEASSSDIDMEISKSNIQYPSLFDVVKKNLLNGESEWALIYCFYASNYGESFFSRNDILSLYEESKRATPSRKSNLSNNLQMSFKNNYISQINEQDMCITDAGIEQAKSIVLGQKISPSKSKKEKDVAKENGLASSKSSKRETYTIVDLELSEEQRLKIKELYSSVDPKSQKEQIMLLCYLLKETKGISSFTPNILHTSLKIVDEKTPKVLSQTLRDNKSKDQYLDRSQDGTYSINHIGDDYVRFTLLQGANK